jgi:hypothetical protein
MYTTKYKHKKSQHELLNIICYTKITKSNKLYIVLKYSPFTIKKFRCYHFVHLEYKFVCIENLHIYSILQQLPTKFYFRFFLILKHEFCVFENKGLHIAKPRFKFPVLGHLQRGDVFQRP